MHTFERTCYDTLNKLVAPLQDETCEQSSDAAPGDPVEITPRNTNHIQTLSTNLWLWGSASLWVQCGGIESVATASIHRSVPITEN